MTEIPGEIRERLEAAERVCLLFGWTASTGDSDRHKAAQQAWSEWADLVGIDFTGPRAHPELGDEKIAELARRLDESRQRTLLPFEEP